jgi:hypothetical protein
MDKKISTKNYLNSGKHTFRNSIKNRIDMSWSLLKLQDWIHKDVILSIGAFAVVDDSIFIGDSFETILLQYKYLHDNKLSNEFIIESKMNKLGKQML